MDLAGSDFAECITDRKSPTNYLFHLTAGATSWRSRKGTIVFLSTRKAEYVTLYTAALDVRFLKSSSGDVVLSSSVIVCNKGDYETSLQIVQEARLIEASKNILIYYHFIREKFEQ